MRKQLMILALIMTALLHDSIATDVIYEVPVDYDNYEVDLFLEIEYSSLIILNLKLNPKLTYYQTIYPKIDGLYVIDDFHVIIEPQYLNNKVFTITGLQISHEFNNFFSIEVRIKSQ